MGNLFCVLRGVDLRQGVVNRDLVRWSTRPSPALVVLRSLVPVDALDRGRVSEITRAPYI